MGSFVFGLVAASLLLPASAAPDRKVTAYQSKLAQAADDPDKMVCKKEEGIGSRLAAKKVCLTVREWQQIADQDRERTERVQSSTCVPGAGCL